MALFGVGGRYLVSSGSTMPPEETSPAGFSPWCSPQANACPPFLARPKAFLPMIEARPFSTSSIHGKRKTLQHCGFHAPRRGWVYDGGESHFPAFRDHIPQKPQTCTKFCFVTLTSTRRPQKNMAPMSRRRLRRSSQGCWKTEGMILTELGCFILPLDNRSSFAPRFALILADHRILLTKIVPGNCLKEYHRRAAPPTISSTLLNHSFVPRNL